MDSEFSENGTTIELISIGFVSADGREYYAVSNEFDPEACNDWVKENVLPLLPPMEARQSRAQIRDEIVAFCSARGQRPEFVSYCSSYDFVVLCWLFGSMAELPAGWPWWCYDIRQLQHMLGDPELPEQTGTAHNALMDARWHRDAYNYLKGLAQANKDAAVKAVHNLGV